MLQTIEVICASSRSLPYLIVTLPRRRRRRRFEHVLLHIKHSYTLHSSAAPLTLGILERRHLFFLLSPWEQFFALSRCLAFMFLLLIIVYLGSHLAGSDPLPMPWFTEWLDLLCREVRANPADVRRMVVDCVYQGVLHMFPQRSQSR